MNQTIGQTLTRLRTEQGLSQRELAAQLCAAGVQVSNQAVSKWENDSTQPSARQFLALLRIFGVRDSYAPEELPRKTSLQKALAAHIENGGTMGSGLGLFLFDGKTIR